MQDLCQTTLDCFAALSGQLKVVTRKGDARVDSEQVSCSRAALPLLATCHGGATTLRLLLARTCSRPMQRQDLP